MNKFKSMKKIALSQHSSLQVGIWIDSEGQRFTEMRYVIGDGMGADEVYSPQVTFPIHALGEVIEGLLKISIDSN